MTWPDALSPRVAIWGTFDVANFGDHLFPRIFEVELRRRLPAAHVQAFSPLGHLHPLPLDGGLVVEPLGTWSPERLAELARDYDLVAIGGGEIIHLHDDAYAQYYGTTIGEARRLRPSAFFIDGLGAALEERCPVAWHSVGIPFDLKGEAAERVRAALQERAYVSVRDEISRERLVRAGVTRDVELVPDSALLVDRVVGEQQLERRLAQLRAVGSYPSEPPLVVQGSRLLLAHVPAVANALTTALAEAGDVPVLLLEAGACHGDGEFADALAGSLPGRVYRMPPSPTVEDVVAAIVHSRGFVGISLHGNLVAFTHGLPSTILDLAGFSKLAGFAALAGYDEELVRSPDRLLPAIRRVLAGDRPLDRLPGLRRRVELHFDALAELAERSAARRADGRARPADDGPAAREVLRRAFDARGRRLVEQRLRLAERIEELEGRRAATEQRLVGAGERVAELELSVAAQEAAAQASLAAVEAEAAEASKELARIRATKTFRYTARLRALYGGVRRLFV